MPAHRPEDCDRLLIEAMEKGDVDLMISLYEPNATFVAAPGRLVTGHAAIREVLQSYIAARATGTVEAVSVVPSADDSVAITRSRGSVTTRGPDGTPVTRPFHSVEVVRRQPDGTWRFVIDDPTGEGLEATR